MRILMLSWEFPPKSVGGLARHVEDLTQAMADKGNEVHIITGGVEGASAEEIRNGVHIHRVNPFSIQCPDFIFWIHHLNMAMIEKAIDLLNSEDFQIIHAHDWLVAMAGRVIKHSYRLPLIATIHATECGRNSGLHNEGQHYISSIEWFLTYEAWKVIVCSRHMKNEVMSLFGLPEDKIKILPNGIFPEKFKIPKEKRWAELPFLNKEDRVILFVGRLVREKGIDVLLGASPKILSSIPNARIVVVGKGPMEGHLRSMAGGSGDRVCFTGYVSDEELKSLYHRAEVAVFPSLYEPFGIVALEAMATETPVVVSDTGGLSEIVRHGENGLKAYPGNANSLADNILAILHDKKLASRLVRNASATIKNEYDWKQIARKTVALYKEVWKEYERSTWAIPEENITKRYTLVGKTKKRSGGGIQ